VKKEELAQAVAACKLDPAVWGREGREALFEDRYYPTIFASASATQYLNRYWMMRRVTAGARGYPQRSYAKWLVLHFSWSVLGHEIERSGQRFMSANELNDESLDQLDRAIDAVYTAALQFYRENRGKGPAAADVANFFKVAGQNKQFERFWNNKRPKARARFERAQERFVGELKEIEE
jgi:hypothetical protein